MERISRDESITISTTSVQVAPVRLTRRGVYITNTSLVAIGYIKKGDTAAVAGSGIPLQPKGTWFEVDSSDSATCWRGAIQVVGDAAGTISISEDMDV